MQEIFSQEFIKQAQSPNAVVFDVRDFDEYVYKHIPKSINIPLKDLESKLAEFPKDKTIYLLCQCGNRSAKAYRQLESAGFTNLVNVTEGIEGYEKAGGEVVQKSKTITLTRQAQIVYALMTLIGILLAQFVSPHAIWISFGAATILFFAGISGFCLVTVLLLKLPWNKAYQK